MFRQALLLLRSDVMAATSRLRRSGTTEDWKVLVGIAAVAAVPTAVLLGAVLAVLLREASAPGAALLVPVVVVVAFLSISDATGARLIKWSMRPDLSFLQMVPGALGASIVSEGLLRPLLVAGGLSIGACVAGAVSTLFGSTVSGADLLLVLALGPVLSAALLAWSAVVGLVLAVVLARLPRTLRTTLWLAGYLPVLTVFWGLVGRSVFSGSGTDFFRAVIGRFPSDLTGRFVLAAAAALATVLGVATLLRLLRGTMPRRALALNTEGVRSRDRRLDGSLPATLRSASNAVLARSAIPALTPALDQAVLAAPTAGLLLGGVSGAIAGSTGALVVASLLGTSGAIFFLHEVARAHSGALDGPMALCFALAGRSPDVSGARAATHMRLLGVPGGLAGAAVAAAVGLPAPAVALVAAMCVATAWGLSVASSAVTLAHARLQAHSDPLHPPGAVVVAEGVVLAVQLTVFMPLAARLSGASTAVGAAVSASVVTAAFLSVGPAARLVCGFIDRRFHNPSTSVGSLDSDLQGQPA